MDQKNNKAFTNGNIDLSILYKSVSNNLKQILTLPFIFVFLYTLYFLFSNPTYSSSVSFYTSYNKSGSSSILSLLPSNLGIQNDNSLSFSVSNLMMSDEFLKDIVQKEFIIEDEKISLINHWSKNYNSLLTLNPIAFLSKINSRLMDNHQLSIDERKLSYSVRTLRNSLQFFEDRDSLLNTIIVLSDDSDLSHQIASEVYDSIVRYSYEITNQKGKEKREFVNSRLIEVKTELEDLENQLLNFLETNKNLNSPSLLLQKNRLEKDINLYTQLYFTLSDQRELAIIDEKDNTSSIFLLNPPQISSKKVGLNLYEGIFIIFIFSFTLSLIIHIYKNRKELF